jgi:hypothetical protein
MGFPFHGGGEGNRTHFFLFSARYSMPFFVDMTPFSACCALVENGQYCG